MAERRLPSDDEFPSNANGPKVPAEKPERPEPMVLRGKAKKEHSVWKSVKGEFVSEDAGSVGGYILYDILLPALRDLVSDIGHSFIDVAMGGGSGRSRSSRSRRDRDRERSYISYNRMYDDREDRYSSRSRRDRDRDLEDIMFDYREDAEDCLERLLNYLERYDDVPISYLYDILGWTIPGAFTDDDWGWTNLASARIRPVRGRFRLELPRVKPL